MLYFKNTNLPFCGVNMITAKFLFVSMPQFEDGSKSEATKRS